MPFAASVLLAGALGAWRPVDPNGALVVDTSKGRIIVALEPRLAPRAVARVKRLARMHVYDGLLMWRVIDEPGFNFVQTGDPHNHDGDRSSLPDLRAEFATRLPAAEIRFVRGGREPEGFLGVIPVGASAESGRPMTWGAYCDGVMGMGRERGTTRYFDHDYTVVGRIVEGLSVVRDAAVGVPPAHPDRMIRVRVLADIPAYERPRLEVLDTASPAFASMVTAARRAHGGGLFRLRRQRPRARARTALSLRYADRHRRAVITRDGVREVVGRAVAFVQIGAGVLESLRPQIRDGICVVGLEPSCVSVFRDEMTNLLGPDEDAKRLKQQTFLLTEFLANKAPGYAPPPLHRKALVQEHCHHKSILDPSGESKLFDALQLDYEIPDTGCCGMAGPFGFDATHYDVSMAIGERALLPKVRAADPRTIIVADGFSCREQISQTTGRQALHPAQVLKMALDDRGKELDDPLPERRFMPRARVESARAAVHGTLALVALAGAATLLTFLFRRRR